ncbi:MAG: hypothetical protein MPJ22_02415 [Pirellulales bacterium]|nr:hypothetical protein [Alphaproteobacteria bacterium]MDA8008699.1 hypothetical protein [Alphaproteobacteria bacterium]MDA8041262.1 hypothetical protein [Pirellulales bacterium]
MTMHVFIVDARTFKIHLEHLFVGTGSTSLDKYHIHFRDGWISPLRPGSGSRPVRKNESNAVSMIADAGRVRRGDQIVFYLKQNLRQGIGEGKFFGIFEAAQDGFFFDDNGEGQHLRDELGKSLTFRALIEPQKVYAGGVTEWEALDEIRNIRSPNQMLWSLIYRKLKGNRGNTMVTICEAERLAQLIRDKNGREELSCGNRMLSFDMESQRVLCLDEERKPYGGRRGTLDLLPRMIEKNKAGQVFEAHLQAYITRHIGTGFNRSLDDVLLGGAEAEWFGNEVSCGVGMQRIDVMVSAVKDGQRAIVPIELKAVGAEVWNVGQIQRYVNWVVQYYTPNRPSDIQPVLLTKRGRRRIGERPDLVAAFGAFNANNKGDCLPLRYIEFNLDDDALSFEEVSY